MKTNETNTTTAIAAQSTKSTVLLSIDKIHPNPNNPRRSYDENALAELAASIATHGLIQPIRVRAAEQGGYIIVCGERRYRAVQLLGQTEIEAIVDAAPPTDKPRKIRAVSPTATAEHRVVYSDIDFNRHVNTMRYIEMMLDMLPVDMLTQEAPVRLDIHFLKECRFGQTLTVGCELRGRSALFEISADGAAAAVRASIEWK